MKAIAVSIINGETSSTIFARKLNVEGVLIRQHMEVPKLSRPP